MKKIPALLVIIALIPFLLGVHDCTGEDCLFCAQMGLLRAAFVWTAGLTFLILSIRPNEQLRQCSALKSPVSLRVRLLN